MWRRLNTLEVFFRGGQPAVDEFNKSTLAGIEKTKAIAIAKASQGGRNGQGGQPPGKRRRRSGGGQLGTGFSAPQATQQALAGQTPTHRGSSSRKAQNVVNVSASDTKPKIVCLHRPDAF
jgi:hypothetical protein